jgi:hypothetical protein
MAVDDLTSLAVYPHRDSAPDPRATIVLVYASSGESLLRT